jgi:YVTN family beta-propeller protein
MKSSGRVTKLLLMLTVTSISFARTQLAYVANIDSNTVSVINVTKNKVITNVAVGDGPWGVAVNPSGTRAYVVNNHDTALGDSVSVINTASNTVISTVKVQSVPFAAAVTPDGKFVYVTNANSNTVSVIKASNNTVIATVPVEQYPVGITIPNPGGFVYVANDVSGTVSVISVVTNTVVATIPVGANPTGMAATPDGSTVFAMNDGSSNVSVISTLTNTVSSTIPVSAEPFGGAVSPDGQFLYVANESANLVTIIDVSTLLIDTTVAVGTSPVQVAFTSDSQYAYVTNLGSNNVSVISTSSKTLTNTVGVGTAPIGAGITPAALVSTVAGGFVGDGRPATQAALHAPHSMVKDKAGNTYISDYYGNRIRKVTAQGVISTFAGTGIAGYNGDNIAASSATLSYPSDIIFDSAGNLLVADTGNGRVRAISTAGIITTIAGTGEYGYSGDGGPAIRATFANPFWLVLDSQGFLYISDIGNSVVRRIDGNGIITTYAGNGIAGFSGDGGPATSASLNSPRGLTFDNAGSLYIADTLNYRVRKVSKAGKISTFAGDGIDEVSGDGGQATAAGIGTPKALSIFNGTLYICHGSNTVGPRVRAVNLKTGVISPYIGMGYGFDGDNNPLLASLMAAPNGILTLPDGSLSVADTNNGRVRNTVGGVLSTQAGGYVGDNGNASQAALTFPQSIRFDSSGNYYIADTNGNRIRKVTANGVITTIAGTGITGYSGDGGPATQAQLSYPDGVALDALGNLYIADAFNGVIRKVDSTGTISTFTFGMNAAQMAFDAQGNLYAADWNYCVVWKISPQGVPSVFAGIVGSCGYNGDGVPATSAELNSTYGVAVDATGNVLIADTVNSRIRQVDTSGTITTIAGNGVCSFSGDGGPAVAAELCYPVDIALNATGDLFITDEFNLRIRKISQGVISTYAGTFGYGFNGDGNSPLQTCFDDPVSAALDPHGTVYVVDDVEDRVRRIF